MSLFDHVEPFPPDPIFGLGARIKKDENPNKIDLTVGVYHDDELKAVTMQAVKEAEKKLLDSEKNKTYLPMGGKEDYLQVTKELIFGKDFVSSEGERLFAAQTLGGTGALRIGGDFIFRELSKKVYVSSPTWPNHKGIFGAVGMEICTYPYYSEERKELDFDRMLDTLSQAPEKSVVVLHTCCHNPSGCDPTQEQWKELSHLILRKKLIPFFDFAYLGFAKGIEEDPWPIRYFAEQGHELFVAASFSKNFGLYGERTGCLLILSKKAPDALSSVVKRIIRTNYSNPPRHGASLVALILQDEALRKTWQEELDRMRERVERMRTDLCEALTSQFGEESFGFLKTRYGMFSLLGLKESQVNRMIDSFSVYLTGDGRINLTGLNSQNLSYVVDAIIKTRE